MAVKSAQYIFEGQTYELTYNSDSGRWEATVVAPAVSSYSQTDHKLGGEIVATDDAGNEIRVDETHSTLGESLKIRVMEKVAPTIVITYPTASAFVTNATPAIAFTVTDDDSGVNPDTIKLTIDSTDITDGITKTPITNGYECTYTPADALGDGAHTISVNASDNDENAATAQTVSFTVDTVPPTLSVTNPADGLITNAETITVEGTTSDSTSNPVTVTVNGENVTIGGDGSFTHDVTLVSGENKITVIAKDSAGKTTTIERTVTLDSGAPVIHSITLTPNPIDAGKTFIISVEITD